MNAEPAVQNESALSVSEEARAIVQSRIGSLAWQNLNELERIIENHPAAFRELPTHHLFPKDLYVREVFMKKGDIILTRVHMVEHAFIVSCGVFLVWSDENGWEKVTAFHSGITKPGTRRLILILEDTIFTTVHPNPKNETDPDKIVEEVTFEHLKLREKEAA